ncbi:uncharacterized protein LOC111891725 [Lactuca sativa]|uniref:uncharacterized protein LOC111891725 n=1 Tax=Lactuca sativa TaxID=4236 RepID=UPI0022AFECE9|nr:uncharacterized protein LOC111891725 [Lactuca sativa]
MSEKAGAGEFFEEDTGDNEDVYPELPNIFNDKLNWKEQEPVLGMRFESPKQLKHMLCNYVAANGYQLCFVKNDTRRLLVKCCDGKCTFRLWGSWMSEDKSFQIKSLISEHNCAKNFKFGSIVTYKWIGTHFKHQFYNNQKMSVQMLREEVKTNFGINVSMSRCRRAKKYALSLVEGTIAENYARLWSYGEEIRRSNPGSTVKICVDSMPDGELLCVVGRDANNGIFPIAWAVVSVENKENWKWLLKSLSEDLQCWNDGNGLVLISDQHKGLIEAVKEVFPAAENRQCARHIYANFRKTFSGSKFENLFWKASKATTEAQFNVVMKEIGKLNPETVVHLMARDPKTWSLVFFRVHNSFESVENGFSESFNSVILDARKKPIISMLEDIRIYVMQRMVTMKLTGQGWNAYSVCPNIRIRLNMLQTEQRHWHVISCGGMKFEARKMDEAFTVDVEKKECSCRLWQLNGYGCVHSVTTLAYLNLTPDGPYVDPMYLAALYHNTYKQPIHGMNGQNMWPSTDLIPPLPPLKRRMPGRPTIKRRRDASERMGKHTVCKAGKKVSCSICKEKGHNKATWDDEVIVDAIDALDRPRDEEKMVGVNGRDEGVNVNARVKHVKPPKMQKKSERIIKLKLAKNVGGEGSSVATTMDLD